MLWAVGTVVAAAVAWQSLRFVSTSTEGELATGTPSADVTVPTPSGQIAEDAAASTSITTPSSTSADSPVDAPDATTDRITGSATTGVDSNTGAGSTVESVRTDGQITEQTFDLIGGRAAIRFTPEAVVVAWATPAPGYTVDTHAEDQGVEVEFKNGAHESKIEAWWAGGPRFEISERDD